MKEIVDILLTGGTVVTMDSEFRVIEDGAVAVKGDKIVAVGPASELESAYRAEEINQCDGQAITPGLINAHTHAPMTLLRGLANDRRLDVWLMGYMMPTEHEFVTPEFCYLGTQLACAEMIRSGVTTFTDMYYFEAEVARAAADAGMRAICGETILKFPSPDAASYDESLAYARDFIEKWRDHPLIVPSVAPHAPYTSTDEMLRACVELAQEFDVPLQIHIAETRQEVETCRSERGMPVVPWVKKQHVLDAKTIAAHCVHLDQGEIYTLQHHGTGVAHCPTSNLKLASGIAPVADMLEVGVNVGIGTDGPASNNDLDMFQEMHIAAILAKGATYNPTVLPARQAFAMATIMGARAVHLDHMIGSLEIGKRADIAVIDLNGVHNWPHFRQDPNAIYAELVYAAKSSDVRHVMVNGKWLMRDGALLTLNEDVLRERASEIARRIDAFLIEREGNVLSKLISVGGVAQEESFEVQVKARIDSIEKVNLLLEHPDVNIVRSVHYRQYDTYFIFDGERLRYREDDRVENGQVTGVRTRLTYTEPGKKHEFEHAVLLSRSRFIAPADRPLRFYREYFQPRQELEVNKERLRWHIDYKGKRFYVNVDRVTEPPIGGLFLEIKSRTWSRKDAEEKAHMIADMLNILGVGQDDLVLEEYVDLTASKR